MWYLLSIHAEVSRKQKAAAPSHLQKIYNRAEARPVMLCEEVRKHRKVRVGVTDEVCMACDTHRHWATVSVQKDQWKWVKEHEAGGKVKLEVVNVGRLKFLVSKAQRSTVHKRGGEGAGRVERCWCNIWEGRFTRWQREPLWCLGPRRSTDERRSCRAWDACSEWWRYERDSTGGSLETEARLAWFIHDLLPGRRRGRPQRKTTGMQSSQVTTDHARNRTIWSQTTCCCNLEQVHSLAVSEHWSASIPWTDTDVSGPEWTQHYEGRVLWK